MDKISITGIEARKKAIKGMSYVGDAVKSTIGPFGLNFLLEKGNKNTNDGYIIASELCPTIKDEYERRGALVAHEASSRTNEEVGDMTSGAWALTTEITKAVSRLLPDENRIKALKTPAEIKKMLETSKNEVISILEQSAKPITDKETLIKSALVSVEDEEIAEMLGSTQWELGPEGVIIAEEVNDTESSIEIVKGIRLDNGFASSQVVTNPEKNSLEVSDVPVLLTNYTIGKDELLALKKSVFDQLVAQKKWGIVIIARAFTSDAIQLCMDTTRAGFAIFPVNAAYTDQTQIMKDIEAVVGGRYIDTEESRLDEIYISDIGFAKRFVAQQFSSVITGIDDDQSKVRVEKRLEFLKSKLTGEKSDFYKKLLEQRIAQLTTGFGILKVGSHSANDRKRLKDKCDDAVQSVRLALKGGTVKGGGLALKEISEMMTDDNILKRPLTCIYDQIISSAPEGFEIEDWVRDPFLTVKSALTHACATAGTFANTNGIITTKNKKECNCNEKAD